MAKKLPDAAVIAGLASTVFLGACDPAPPPVPLQCTAALEAGEALVATGAVVGSTLVVMIESDFWEELGDNTSWTDVPTLVVGGGSLVSATFDNGLWVPGSRLRVEIRLDDGVTSGTIEFSGQLEDRAGTRCTVARTFVFTVADGAVEVAVNEVPLPGRDAVRIEVVAQDGGTVELRAATRALGADFEWQVTGGELVALERGRARWTLPREPGLYQAEVAADYGIAGLAFDALPFEVG